MSNVMELIKKIGKIRNKEVKNLYYLLSWFPLLRSFCTPYPTVHALKSFKYLSWGEKEEVQTN